mmetsp:Transcript_6309/g.9367  ORF Transcript_6309/g.9367 Transcript_6309/m.9367 type:complete len:276 (+) Transcript_6309:1260-2087(+)|eukprot:CAMPEP_0202426650 /NCGR_PEP_ID=MMETSP1345-20130828/981_1 /ASSEMBLY_ACC=CAM_ASM_000843 /TAXON_ID=342563 /ORGANISM="Fabrea Fabrea salina" /LENGTH=275 /DNA_ID=CAMNT_0049037123 /DNA_START=1141 /DNA_END=1968 /DNA_ORIENTATION=+
MKKGDATHSIMMLKQKFNEIKRNISLIEQRQHEFLSSDSKGSLEVKQSFQPTSQEQNLTETQRYAQTRPASAGRMLNSSRTSSKEDSYTDYLTKKIRILESQNQNLNAEVAKLKKQNEEYIKENATLRDKNTSSSLKVSQLQRECNYLKEKLDNYEQTTPKKPDRPASCIRSASSTPKKHRVAFSKDLVKVVHINGNDCPQSIEKLKQEISPYNSPNKLSQTYATPVKDKYFPLYRHQKAPSMKKLDFKEPAFSDYYKERSRIISRKNVENERPN